MKNNSKVKNWVTFNPENNEVFVYQTYKEAWEKSENFFALFGRVLLVEPLVELN